MSFGLEMELGREAAGEALRRIFRVDVLKALDPLKKRDFVVIVERLTRKVAAAAAGEEAAVLSAALDALDVDWRGMSPRQLDEVVRASNLALEAVVKRAVPKIEAVLEVEGPRIQGASRRSARLTHKLEIAADLSKRDLEAERAIRVTTTNFVRDQYGRRVGELSAAAREIVARGVQEGSDPIAIGARLRDNLGDRISRSDAYWRVVATSFANKGRIHSQLSSFDDAGIETYEFVAVLDEVTTDACRFYHGRTFSTSDGLAAMDRQMSLEDPEEVRETNPWVQSGRDQEGNRILYVKQRGRRVRLAVVDRSGVGTSDDLGEFSKGVSDKRLVSLGIPIPPLHGLCRSNILPR